MVGMRKKGLVNGLVCDGMMIGEFGGTDELGVGFGMGKNLLIEKRMI